MPIPDEMMAALRQLRPQLTSGSGALWQQLAGHLTGRELAALATRLERLLETAVFPNPGPGRHYPWPPV
jgi:hypothetical protein